MLGAPFARRIFWDAFPLIAFLLFWEAVASSSSATEFFISKPSIVAGDLFLAITRDGILIDVAYTLLPCLIGLTLALCIGGAVGFSIIAFPKLPQRVGVYVAILGAIPVFAIAPMTIIWFGIGMAGKVFLATLASVFVFLQACYLGGISVPENLLLHFKAHRFSESETFWKLRLPFAIDWMVSAFKTCANLALLGVFVGEFVTSERGLGRVMLNAGGLYDVKRVLSAAICFAALALGLMGLGNLVIRHKRAIIRYVSVPRMARVAEGEI
jgi:NitT/TauT family transport system permease protein